MRFSFAAPGVTPIEISDDFINLENKLNLGCGQRSLPGFVNLDYIEFEGVNVVHDFEKEDLPFPDDHFNFIFLKSILEHVPHRVPRVDGDFMYHLINDLIRISKDGAIWDTLHPCHPLALQATDHPRIIGPATFDPWTRDYSSLEATMLPKARMEMLSKKNIRRWALNSSFGRTIVYRMTFRIHKLGD